MCVGGGAFLSPRKERQKKKSTSFSPHIVQQNSWVYHDSYVSKSPHFVLLDSSRTPRFALAFDRKIVSGKEWVCIDSIQRLRSTFAVKGSHTKGEKSWNPIAERKAALDLKKELGVHPAEYLLSAFLSANRSFVREGNVFIAFTDEDLRLYRPLVDRFFEPLPETKALGIFIYRINLNRRRVKEILSQRAAEKK